MGMDLSSHSVWIVSVSTATWWQISNSFQKTHILCEVFLANYLTNGIFTAFSLRAGTTAVQI